MRKILFALLCLVSATCVAQAPFEMGAIKIDSIYFNGTSKWVDSLVTNYKLPYASDQQIPSAKAVKEFVADTVSQIIHDSISGLSFTSTALSDSIDKHTDTLQLHNTRINALRNGLYDSIARHTDTLQLHDVRLKALLTGVDTLGQGIVDDTLKFDNGSYITIAASGEYLVLGTENDQSFITEVSTGSGTYASFLSTDFLKLTALEDKPLVLQVGMLAIDKADTNLYVYKTGGWSLVGGGGSGTGDVKVSGTTIANTIAYWSGTDSTLVSNDVVKLYADSAVFTEPVFLHDTLYLAYLDIVGLAQGSVWFTNTPTGGVDSAATEPAYIGWEMDDLPTLEEYEADIKMINGHMERRVWYIDYETKELKSQYGWSGLGMMNTQSAYMIYHEITVRWMFEQNKKLDQNKRSVLKRKVKDMEQRLEAIENIVHGK